MPLVAAASSNARKLSFTSYPSLQTIDKPLHKHVAAVFEDVQYTLYDRVILFGVTGTYACQRKQVALLWQRDRATRLSVEILQLTKHPI